MTCECLVELSNVFFDKTFTYLVPSEFQDKIKVGMRVKVPFGNQILEGFVVSISKNKKDMELKTKKVDAENEMIVQLYSRFLR